MLDRWLGSEFATANEHDKSSKPNNIIIIIIIIIIVITNFTWIALSDPVL